MVGVGGVMMGVAVVVVMVGGDGVVETVMGVMVVGVMVMG